MRSRSLAVLALMLFVCLHASAAEVDFADLAGARGVTLPYAEPISLHGNLTQLRSMDGETLVDWMDIRQLRVIRILPGQPEEVANAQIDPDSQDWRVLLKPLPQAAMVTFHFEVTGRLNRDGTRRVLERLLTDPGLSLAARRFFKSSSGKSPAESAPLFLDFVEEASRLIEQALPPFLALNEKGTRTPPGSLTLLADRDRFRRLVNLSESMPAVIKLARRAGGGLEISEAELSDPIRLHRRLEEISRQRNNGLPQDAQSFMADFAAARELVQSLIDVVTARSTVSTELSAPAQVQDLQRYAGIDIGALYSPAIDELRQFILVNVYFGPVDDRPRPASASQGFLASRLSLSVGMETGDLGGGGDSVIKDGKAYAVGLGFRLNKYFRLGAGGLIYRSSASNELKRTGYLGISMDLTGFKALQGLVSK